MFRGEYPYYFSCSLDWPTIKELTSIPGVIRASGGLRCSADVAEILARKLNLPVPHVPVEWNMSEEELAKEISALPGLARYHELGLHQKLFDYQKEGALFLARRHGALNCMEMRLGKTLQALAASILINARRTLVVCPSIAKWVWASEIAKWLGEETLILEGRGCDEARIYCIKCNASGLFEGKACDACKKRNGQSDGYRLLRVGGPGKCRKHNLHEPRCSGCIKEIHAAFESARYVVCNYDLLTAQREGDAAGKVYFRDDLPGWGPFIGAHKFDLCIGDEFHYIRGRNTDQRKRGTTRRERFNLVTESIPRVWGLTGTPIFGYVRDLWGQLDALSKGCITGKPDRLFFDFDRRYCGPGHRGEYGWVADGSSNEDELKERLRFVKIQRSRAEVWKSLPRKTRRVIRIDSTRESRLRGGQGSDYEGRIAKLLAQSFAAKAATVVENIVEELCAGEKVIAFTFLRESAEKLYRAINLAVTKRDVVTRMRSVSATTWLVHGEEPTMGRVKQAQGFVDHSGAGVFIATINAVREAVSLRGATSIHFVELDYQPSAVMQVEDRAFSPTSTGIGVTYYIVKHSIDERIEQILMPKIEAKDRIETGSGAKELGAVFDDEVREDSLASIIESLTSVADLEGYIEDGSED